MTAIIVGVLLGLVILVAVIVWWYNTRVHRTPPPVTDRLSYRDHRRFQGSFCDVIGPKDTVTMFINLIMTRKELESELNGVPIQTNQCLIAQPNSKCNRLKLFSVMQEANNEYLVQGCVISSTRMEFLKGQFIQHLYETAVPAGGSLLLWFKGAQTDFALVVTKAQEQNEVAQIQAHYRQVLSALGTTKFILGGAANLIPSQWKVLDQSLQFEPPTLVNFMRLNYFITRGMTFMRHARFTDYGVGGLEF